MGELSDTMGGFLMYKFYIVREKVVEEDNVVEIKFFIVTVWLSEAAIQEYEEEGNYWAEIVPLTVHVREDTVKLADGNFTIIELADVKVLVVVNYSW